ncbi:hypothetical protein IJ00_17495 [Calothrix sp. 336/3]|nr:hypothetical protein IJ00_17495 [Calothrix sp. 336/3]
MLLGVPCVIILALGIVSISNKFIGNKPHDKGTLSYSQFIQEVENGSIKKVSISSDRTTAIATFMNGQTKLVILENDLDFINQLTKHSIDISVSPPTK